MTHSERNTPNRLLPLPWPVGRRSPHTRRAAGHGPGLGVLPALLILVLVAVGTPVAAAPDLPDGDDLAEPVGSDAAYSYFRVVEGTATLFPFDNGVDPTEPQQVGINQPALAGDRLTVAPASRLEMVLSDGTLLRVGGGSELVFEHLSGSPETEDRQTVLRLGSGEIQVVAFDDNDGEPAVVESPQARIVLREPGSYRISVDALYAGGATRVVVRDGTAEVATGRGSVLVRAGDEATIEGGERARLAFSRAREEDPLESWGRELWQQATATEPEPVDRSLRYSAASLSDHGDWVSVGGRTAWRPHVASDWRPYWSGNWVYTPSGFLWVSYEPWGWIPYHYGTWALDPGFGWVWFPGSRFAPAWVYWYWGPSEVAWIPIGFYSHHYAFLRHGFGHFGLRFGLYGWAGGSSHVFRNWLFCDYGSFRRHDLRRHARPWDRFDGDRRDGNRDRRTRRDAVPRGIVTTDTRGLDRRDLLEPRRIGEDLPRRLASRRGGELPDVTPFVAREPNLSPELERRLVAREPGERLAGTPLAPGTVRPTRPRAESLSPRRVSAQTPAGRGDNTPGDRGSLRAATPRGITLDGNTRDTTLGRRTTVPDRSGLTPGRPGTVRPDTPGPRVLRPDTVTPRSAPPSSVRPQTVRPQAPRPQTVTPRPGPTPRTGTPSTRRPSTVTPRSVTPRTLAPRTGTPHAVTPRSETPRSVSPRPVTPRATTPSRSAPTPRNPRPSTVRPNTVRPNTVRPNTVRPNTVRPPAVRSPSASRAPAPRSLTPRSSTPRSGSSLRPTRPSIPRAGARVGAPRPAAPRATAPRASAPRSTAPRASTPHSRSGASSHRGSVRGRSDSSRSHSSSHDHRGAARRGQGSGHDESR